MPGMQALPLKTASWPGWYAICSNKGRKTEKLQDMKKEKVNEIELDKIDDFPYHPFKVIVLEIYWLC